MGESVWVLTKEYNEYDQHGNYFVAVFAKKPTVEKLLDALLKDECDCHSLDVLEALKFIQHILNGGGRISTEYSWYNLDKVELR